MKSQKNKRFIMTMSRLVPKPKILNQAYQPLIFIPYFREIHVDLLVSVLIRVIIIIISSSSSSSSLKSVTQAQKCLNIFNLARNKAQEWK
jgi:hypothetical protein